MIIERTCSIIKPNAIKKNVIGNIISRFEDIKMTVVGIKMLQLSYEQAKIFYFEHKEKIFFNNLINFMISGPIIVQILEGQNVIQRNREVMGATNPSKALAGTLRFNYADSLIENAIHGSDSVKSAQREITYFFTTNEIFSRNY